MRSPEAQKTNSHAAAGIRKGKAIEALRTANTQTHARSHRTPKLTNTQAFDIQGLRAAGTGLGIQKTQQT